ncbi:MAG: glycerophosphodiester phosphodiesterase [Thermomicrobiales bacterium]
MSSHWHVAHDLVVHLEPPFIHVYAHRGASIELPENTLASFRRALELDPFGIELDLHLSADGVPMVIHDDSVDRTTNGRGTVSSLSWAEMQTLPDAAVRLGCPTQRGGIPTGIDTHAHYPFPYSSLLCFLACIASFYPQAHFIEMR